MSSNAAGHARTGALASAAVFTVWAVYFYGLMEWLFFVTKPSFFSAAPLSERLAALWLAPLPVAVLALGVILVLYAAAIVARKPTVGSAAAWIALGIPAVIVSSSLFTLVDNFTYTLFHVGVISLKGSWRLIYGLFYVALCSATYYVVLRAARNHALRPIRHPLTGGAGILLLLSCGTAVATFERDAVVAQDVTGAAHASRRPNILVLGADGLSADHVSAYGYERDTTPFLRTLLAEALVVENAFANAGNTGGSITAMLTGKLPTQTRMIYPPDILRGRDAYEHLPGILKKLGYHTLQISTRHYGDAYDSNLRGAFDVSNFRSLSAVTWLERFVLRGHSANTVYVSSLYFLEQIYGRLEERLLHAFSVRAMMDPFAEVNAQIGVADGQRIAALLTFLGRPPEPFFAHVHFLGTHGPFFLPYERRFSGGKTQDAPWMTDFYDDAIGEFDSFVRYIIEDLRARDRLRDTIIVLYSDHGMQWKPDSRVPLLFLFPDRRFVGRTSDNAQLVDVAPTLLNYLGIEPPNWMAGQTLIRSRAAKLRPIITVSNAPKTGQKGQHWQKSHSPPPFYSLGTVYTIVCQRIFRLDLASDEFVTSDVNGHTAPCGQDDIPNSASVRRDIMSHLRDNGYDVSSLQTAVDADTGQRSVAR